MTTDKPIHILARLEVGFRTDAAHLKELEQALAVTLLNARQFGRKHGSPDDWTTNSDQQWDNVEGHLRRIRMLVSEMHDGIESRDRESREGALAAWETIQSEDAQLEKALSGIRAQASALNAAVRRDWNLLARTLEPHLETIYACAHALRVKLELLEKHSKEEVEQLVQHILSRLPDRTQAAAWDAETYQQEYDKAVIQLEQEQHEFLGVGDFIKSFWQWFESPEERMRKNRSLRVDEA